MDHVVYLDSQADELEKLENNEKSMLIRGAAGRKMPYGRVFENDTLYFINNNSEGLIKGRALVNSVFNSEKMTKEDSEALVNKNLQSLNLTEMQKNRWSGKRYLVLIGVKNFERIEPFSIDKSNFGNMDDWLPVGNIKEVRL